MGGLGLSVLPGSLGGERGQSWDLPVRRPREGSDPRKTISPSVFASFNSWVYEEKTA